MLNEHDLGELHEAIAKENQRAGKPEYTSTLEQLVNATKFLMEFKENENPKTIQS